MREERGVEGDHATRTRWVLKYAPEVEKPCRRRKRPVGTSWRRDETYGRVTGQGKYFYGAVDKEGQSVDFLLTARRDCAAAKRFLPKAIGSHGFPEKVTSDKSGAKKAALESYNTEQDTAIENRQSKYLNNIVEQDHRAVKCLIRPRLGCKSFGAAQNTLAGIEVMHRRRKGQLQSGGGEEQTLAEQFYALAA